MPTTPPNPEIFEKLSSFYLGRHVDLNSGEMSDELLMYDAKDLCTHAMCVGMTGSGKTGLCISLLEEAAIDGVPAICVDPKGDLANLLLTFPELRPEDFRPWLDEGEARRKGKSLDELALDKAELWRSGLAQWGQTEQRIKRLKEAVDVAIYTPGSNIGLPLTVLKSFDAPPPESRDDAELVGDRVTGAVSGLLTLMGIDADPMTSSEHILISSILADQWSQGKNVGVAQLIRLIQSPPINKIGVIDLDSFMSVDDRSKLALRLNNLLASPAFSSWMEGESLSIKRLLYTQEGKPRLTILSIAHLDDNERMFFVTILLNELLAWMRTQMGTSSLRAMFYMDEVAGYFPPVRNPPTKPPMLTLLKQARAFGLGITLATQNPVDLDYKGLSNIGTWFLGRLQTERDKARVLEGLEGAAGQAGQKFDRARMEQWLAGLASRVFLMNNVHDPEPTAFQTRWAMSYLAGPLARGQISKLMAERKSRQQQTSESATERASTDRSHVDSRPVIPAGIHECFMAPQMPFAQDAELVYRPALLACGSMHFVRASAKLDEWRDTCRVVLCHDEFPTELWEYSKPLAKDFDRLEQPEAGFTFDELPDELLKKGKYRSYRAQFKEYLYRNCSTALYKCPLVKGYAPPGERADAMAYFVQQIREQRDSAIERLRDKYESKSKAAQRKIDKAEDRLDREKSQSRTSMISAASSVVGAVLGGFLGRRRTRISTAARGVGYATQQEDDVRRAQDSLDRLERQKYELEMDLKRDLDELREKYSTENVNLESVDIRPRKGDLQVDTPSILWTPWCIEASGAMRPLFEVGGPV